MWAALVSLGVTLFAIGAIYCTWRAATTARTPQGAVGWVVFLLAAPFIAVPIYLFLGHHRFNGYQQARRQSERVVAGIRAFSAEHAPPPDVDTEMLAPFQYCAGLDAVRGNQPKLLIDGAAAFDAIFDAIDAATKTILVQFYIVRDDDLGRALQDRLIAAAERGVHVRFMTDGVGSLRLDGAYFAELRAAGVQVAERANRPGPSYRFQINFRNHRKTVVVDGQVGFVGGLNVGDEYMGRSSTFGAWRDTHLQLSGPMVSQLQLIFAEDWHWATREDITPDLTWTPQHTEDDAVGLIVATGPGDLTETGSLMFFSAITAAKTRVWIASPYFIPDIDITAALRNAALRGVDVRLLVPEVVDHWMPWLAAYAYFDDVTEAGGKIYRYTDGFMHQKAFVVDDTIAAVGTTNLDNRSFRLNFEAMAVLFDAPFAHAVAAMLEEDFKRADRLDRTLADQPARIRYGAPLARLFSPLL